MKINFRKVFAPRLLNAIYLHLEYQNEVKELIICDFPTIKFIFTEHKCENVTDRDSQLDLVRSIHNRAHRNYRNNILELSENVFWPTMSADCKKFASKCKVCLTEKYEQKPINEKLNPTPIPSKVGESIQMDLFHLGGDLFISTIDRFSKYCYMRRIPNKKDAYQFIEEIFTQVYPHCTELMTDNENIFTSSSAKSLYDHLGIDHLTTPLMHSTTNAQIERVHSTVLEIANTLAYEHSSETVEHLFTAIKQYNRTLGYREKTS